MADSVAKQQLFVYQKNQQHHRAHYKCNCYVIESCHQAIEYTTFKSASHLPIIGPSSA